MLLQRREIEGKMRPVNGPPTIFIEPFNPANLATDCYDVTLGEWYFRPTNRGSRIFNPYCSQGVWDLWGEPQEAQSASVEFERQRVPVPQAISPDDRVIIIEPHEMILAHTVEFIGGTVNVAGCMQGKSGWSRAGISVCRDAGLGDIGYINRWTMEITNENPHHSVPLIVGRPIAKIAFFECRNSLEETDLYGGSYQKSTNLEEIKRNWTPKNMLPKLYKSI